jgi:protein SCO1/2
VVALAACGAGRGSDAARPGGPGLNGLVRRPLPDVGALALPDAARDGEPTPFRARAGGVLLVAFGYTSCPDICPTTMADLRLARSELGRDRDRVDVAMVTVDPRRDTAAVLTSYVQHFFPHGRALRTDAPGALRAAADGFGVQYEVTVSPDTGQEEVGHTSLVYAVDDHGRVRVAWPFGMDYREITGDLRRLLAA